MDMFILYPVVAGTSLLIWYIALQIVYFRSISRAKKRKQRNSSGF